MNIWWRTRGHHRPIAHPYARNIAGKNGPRYFPCNVVYSMPWRIPSLELQTCCLDYFAVFWCIKLIFRDGAHFTPESIHAFAVDHPGGIVEFFRLSEVRKALWMDVYFRALFGKCPSCARMVKMDMRKKHVLKVSQLPAFFSQHFLQMG